MRALIYVGLLAFVAGCNHRVTPPTTPTPTPPAPEKSACGVIISCETGTFRLTGVVTDDDGRPVAAAKVSVQPWLYAMPSPPRVSTMTGADGSYTIDFNGMRDAAGGVGYVYGDQTDHETVVRYLQPSGQTLAQNLHLYRINRLTAGADASIVVRQDDSICGLDDTWNCRTVRVTSLSAGKVTLSLDSQGATVQSGLETSVTGDSTSYRCCAASTIYDVRAGTQIAVNVLVEWTAKQSQLLTLHTSLQPQ
jgi:hypothetical protein